MDKKYKEWEIQIERAKKHNNELLKEFEDTLIEKSLKPKTIKNHLENIDFFANDYLLRYDITLVEEGAQNIGMFLGDFFIRKASWASKYTIQENIASFKKFYTFLYESGRIPKKELLQMKELIKDEKDEWIEEVENYWNKF